MLSDEYWKDKTTDSKQVACAWLVVGSLIVGGLCVDALARNSACQTGLAAPTQSLADSRNNAAVTFRDLR